MSSPYFPPPPHSTPQHYALNKPRAPRQPVVNPYEKFTQVEFDQWISGITGALRKALGHEPDEPEEVSTIFEQKNHAYLETSDDDEYESEGEGVNDSLADIRDRYVTRLNKGKARDPMEGPGLSTWGKGDKDAPIEIDFDEDGSPDEDALDDEEVLQHLSFVRDSDEEEEQEEEIEGEQFPDEWQLPQSSLRTRTDLDASDQEVAEEGDESTSSDEDERSGSDNVIELLSSDEEPRETQKIASEDEYESSEDEGSAEEESPENVERDEEGDLDASSPVFGPTHPNGVVVADDGDEKLEENRSADEEEDTGEEDGYDEGSDESEEDEFDGPHSSKTDDDQSPEREVITVDSEEEEDQLDDEADTVQPPERDTAFPPYSGDTQARIEIRDPWLGPRTYAEDYYSGGPVLPSPGTVLSAHHLGANDDTEFLTPGVITPAESNEREASPDEELDDQVPHLEFVHGLDTSAEAAPVQIQGSAEVAATYDSSVGLEEDDHSHNNPPTVEVDAKTSNGAIDEGQQPRPTVTAVLEDDVKVIVPSQEVVQDNGEAAREAEDEFDRAYEEMDAEVERENYAEDSPGQHEKQDEHPHQPMVALEISTVTVEEVTIEEASDKEEEEDLLSSSPVVVPLGTSDLDVDVESIFGDEQGELHSDDIFSQQLLEAEGPEGGQVVACAEETEGIEETVEVLEVAENEEVESEQPLDVVGFETLGSLLSADEPPFVMGLEDFPDDSVIQTPIFPQADFVNTAVEVEHEQQQLPTPPAEQETFLQHSPVRHQSPESEVSTERDQPPTEDGEDVEQTPLVSSALYQEVSEAQEVPPLEEVANEVDSTEGILHQAPSERETSSIPVSFDEAIAHPTSVLSVVDDDMGVQDVTEDLDVIPDDWRGIIDEVTSKAPSEEPLPHYEQESAGVYSKEGSIVSLAASDGFNASGPLSYNVEEVFDDEVTDDDADGEVDPDTSLNLIQGDSNSRQLKDLAEEIFHNDWWTSDSSRKQSLEVDTPAHTANDDLSHDKPAAAQATSEETEPPVTFADQRGEEDDIASSREGSPSSEAHLQPTRSPSPTVDPKELMTRSSESVASESPGESPASEKELYQGAEANGQVPTRENTVESIASETLLPIGTTTTLPEEASPTIPGLMLTAPKRPPSPIPGLGAHLSEDTVIEAGDSEIPGLTWSKMFSSSAHVSYGASSISGGPLRSPSFPQIVPSTPAKDVLDFSTSSTTFFMPRTEQGLFLDPYPYSLSTPGLDNVKDGGDDSEDDLEEQDMSMSSSSTTSTAEKDIVGSPAENVKEADNASEKLPAHEVQEIDEPTGSGQADSDTVQDGAQLAEIDDALASGDADQDRDADGDLDPDFLQFPENTNSEDEAVASTEEPLEGVVTPESIELSPNLGITDSIELMDVPDEALEKRSSHSEELPLKADEQAESTCESDALKYQEPDAARKPKPDGVTQAESVDVLQPIHEFTVPGELTPPGRMTPLATFPNTVSAPSQDAAAILPAKPMQNGKRKRSLSPQPRHKTDIIDQQVEAEETASDSDDEDRHQPPTPRGAKRARIDHATNAKRQLSYLTDQSSLSSEEDDNFRASSAGLTDNASPKSRAAAVAVATEPFYPMLHRHGSGAKKQFYQERTPSRRPSQKAQSTTRPSLPPQRPSTSRTTRSNCRYRKISVPKEEDGPRVCFLVPGCSLGDEEVIEENEIEDLGEASYADSLRMIGDIESLDFDLYLIGVLRQLVGVDLLREQEVFYLPAPGEEPARKPRLKKAGSDKSTSGKKSSKSGNLETSSILDTPRHSVASVKAPSSKAGSVSTTASRPTKERSSSTPPFSLRSDSSSDEGEGPENTERKPWKQARGKLDKGKIATLVERSAKSGKQAKRSRRLASDALAYKPVSDSGGESSSDDDVSQPRYKSARTTIRGSIKRSHSERTFAGPEGADGRDAKRHKRDR